MGGVGFCSTVIQRHRYLLTTLALLTFLCSTYLYFTVTLSSSHSCYGLTGKEKAMCQLEQDQTITKGNVTDQS